MALQQRDGQLFLTIPIAVESGGLVIKTGRSSTVAGELSRQFGRPLVRFGLRTIVVLALTAVVPMDVAYAYVDPNAAGPLFQFLFPALVAMVSFAAACKRALRQLWNRLTVIVSSVVRRDRAASDSESPADM